MSLVACPDCGTRTLCECDMDAAWNMAVEQIAEEFDQLAKDSVGQSYLMGATYSRCADIARRKRRQRFKAVGAGRE